MPFTSSVRKSFGPQSQTKPNIPPVRPSANLQLRLDAGDINSYPGTGTTWFDLSGNSYHFNINASAYNSTGPKYMDFNGSFGMAKRPNSAPISNVDVTAIVWTRIRWISNTDWRTLFRGWSPTNPDHQVIIQLNGWEIGMFDNVNGTGFNSTGFSQQSIPGYNTGQWNMLIWRFRNATTPYYSFSYNDTPGTIRGSNNSANSRFKSTIGSIGGYHAENTTDVNNGSQYWGDIGEVSVYNTLLSDALCLQYWNATRARYGR